MANKLCKYCRTEIDAKAKVCPQCKRSQGLSGGAIVLIIIGIIAVVLVMSGACSSFIKGFKEASERADAKKEASKYSESEYKNACRSVTFDEIARDDDMMKGDKVKFTGKVIQVSSDIYRMNVTKEKFGYSDAIALDMEDADVDKKILEDDIVTIWGQSAGSYSYTAVMGQEVTVPKVIVIYAENHGKQKE